MTIGTFLISWIFVLFLGSVICFFVDIFSNEKAAVDRIVKNRKPESNYTYVKDTSESDIDIEISEDFSDDILDASGIMQ